MPQVVQVSLRLPARPQVKSAAFPYGVADVRFTKQTDFEKVPKVGDSFTMAAGPITVPCRVVQRNWDENKNMFVLACGHGRTWSSWLFFSNTWAAFDCPLRLPHDIGLMPAPDVEVPSRTARVAQP